ncbi:MAG: DUF6660 family protein [Chitinophagaceae bacterium]
MKIFLSHILAVYILCSAVVPCSVVDNCELASTTEQSSDHQEEADCKDCSPFSPCSSSYTSSIVAFVKLTVPIYIPGTHEYSDYHFLAVSDYHPSLFQPPRTGR